MPLPSDTLSPPRPDRARRALRAGGGPAELTPGGKARGCLSGGRRAHPGADSPGAPPTAGVSPHRRAHPAPPAPPARARLGPTGGCGATRRPGPAQLTGPRRARLRGGGDGTGATGRAGKGLRSSSCSREREETGDKRRRKALRQRGPCPREPHGGSPGRPGGCCGRRGGPRRRRGQPCCRGDEGNACASLRRALRPARPLVS